MKLSIIIVNYNVRYFLEQCIRSIYRSDYAYTYEIIVVDNASSDDSISMLEQNFPEVKCIANEHNVGFSAANNQGIAIARGEHVLILNPDTVIREDTLSSCTTFMDAHPEVAAVGVKMYDGAGRFLPESKRGIPTSWVAFTKFSGLGALFPNSSLFNRYYLGHLPDERTQEIEILTGAFYYTRKKALEAVGGFDERYFMYGEDIDLSYSMRKEVGPIYYLPSSSIIHFKGESTRKANFSYVRNFYEAMRLFAQKHYGKGQALVFGFGIQLGMWMSYLLNQVNSGLGKFMRVLLDVLILIMTFYGVKEFWERVYYHSDSYYTDSFMLINVPIYIVVSLLSFLYLGKYHLKLNLFRWFKIVLYATLLQLVIYSLLPSEYRPSRMVLLLGMIMAGVFIGIKDRLLGNWVKAQTNGRRFIAVGDSQASSGLLQLLDQAQGSMGEFVGYVSGDLSQDTQALAQLQDLDDIIRSYEVNEVIFDQNFTSNKAIIKAMAKWNNQVQFQLYASDQGQLINSPSKHIQGSVLAYDAVQPLYNAYHTFLKRSFDIGLASALVVGYPFWFGFSISDVGFESLLEVLKGNKTFLGYLSQEEPQLDILPPLPKGIWWHHAGPVEHLSEEQKLKLDFMYLGEFRFFEELAAVYDRLFIKKS